MTRKRISLRCAVLLLATATAACADAGTPLMWAGFLHLIVGNLLIGILEGLVIARLFGSARKQSIVVMIAANYFSMIVGSIAVTLSSQWTGWHRITIHNARTFLIGAVFVSLLASAVLEFPFCLYLMKRTHGWVRAACASVVAQVSSYTLLVPFYFMSSGWSLLRLDDVSASSLARNREAWVYFIDAKDGDVCRVRLDGSDGQRVRPAGVVSRRARLCVAKDKDGKLLTHLQLVSEDDQAHSLPIEPAGKVGVWEHDRQSVSSSWFNFGRAADLRDEHSREWHVSTGFWAKEGIDCWREKPDERLHFALETPLLSWLARNATVLPGDQVVYQLGDHQIVLLDPEQRKIALVALGRGPVVVLPDRSR